MKSVKYLQNYVNEFVDSGTDTISLIDLNIVGTLHFEDVMPVVDIVNSERVKAGVRELKMSAELTKAAMYRAMETAVYWSHTRPNGKSCFTINLNGKALTVKLLAENIAVAHDTPQKVMDSLMKSEGHRANILKSEFEIIGIGCFETADVFYWVQLFGSGNDNSELKCSLYPNEVPFARKLENVEYTIPVYEDLMGFFMIRTEVGTTSTKINAGEKTDISLPFFYASNSVSSNLIAAFEPYITSEDADGKPFITAPSGKTDPDLGVTIVSDRSIYASREATGTVTLYPYKGSRALFSMQMEVVLGTNGLVGDVNEDGKVNAKDVTTLMKAIIGIPIKTYNQNAADINGDGKTNAKDVTALMKRLVLPVS